MRKRKERLRMSFPGSGEMRLLLGLILQGNQAPQFSYHKETEAKSSTVPPCPTHHLHLHITDARQGGFELQKIDLNPAVWIKTMLF